MNRVDIIHIYNTLENILVSFRNVCTYVHLQLQRQKCVAHSIYYLNRGSALCFHAGIYVQLLRAELYKLLSKLKVLPGFSPSLDLHLEPGFYSLTTH